MNRRLPILALFALVLVAGCTTSPKQVAFQTLSVTAQTVDSSLKAYADLVVAGKVDRDTQIKVAGIKGRYEVAFKFAVEAARGDLTKLTPAEVQRLADELANVLKVVLKK